jgi:predicted Zn-dependent protease
VQSDPLLRAMYEELARSKSTLKMENVPAPYYIEYRLTDVDQYVSSAAFGAPEGSARTHTRALRVVVRVGDYKQDSYFGPGVGVFNLAPLDPDPIAMRKQLWLATDRAYKTASEALASKKALLSNFATEQPFDDFARAPVLRSLGQTVTLDFNAREWDSLLERTSGLYRADPKMQYLANRLQFSAVNQYFINTEGTVTRQGYTVYTLNWDGITQAEDGMKLERTPFYSASSVKELPSPDQLLADTRKMLQSLNDLRDAPMVEEEYLGPVLFSPDASSDVFDSMVGRNVLGRRPKPGDSARTTGEYASNYKSRVLPSFLTIADDPSMKTFDGKTLIGGYDIDAEGVRAEKISVIQDGVLVNYLLGREPIRDFPESNGHGRASPGEAPVPSIGNLIVQSKKSSTPEELKKKLLDLCRDEGKPYGYFADTLSGEDPRLLYRVYVSDGHMELVRGASFKELDTRTLRNNLVAVGNDMAVSNREGSVPTTVIAPSILFDELELKRTEEKNAKLPAYGPPDLTK